MATPLALAMAGMTMMIIYEDAIDAFNTKGPIEVAFAYRDEDLN